MGLSGRSSNADGLVPAEGLIACACCRDESAKALHRESVPLSPKPRDRLHGPANWIVLRIFGRVEALTLEGIGLLVDRKELTSIFTGVPSIVVDIFNADPPNHS